MGNTLVRLAPTTSGLLVVMVRSWEMPRYLSRQSLAPMAAHRDLISSAVLSSSRGADRRLLDGVDKALDGVSLI